MLISREELTLRRLTIHKIYPIAGFDYRGTTFRPRGALSVNAVAELVNSDIHIRGHLGTRLEAECDRCMSCMEFPLEHDFDLYYRPVSSIAREEDVEIPRDELEVGFYSGEGVDLADLVKEQVILSLPLKLVCRPDCRGLCCVCGTNLNLKACHCQQPRTDSPFASLLES